MSLNVKDWAVEYHDKVVGWLRPYRGLYAKRGFDLDDMAQEARLALVEQQGYLTRLYEKQLGGCGVLVQWKDYSKWEHEKVAKTIVLRTVRRRLLGRSQTPTPNFTDDGWEEINAAEDREHDAHVQLELSEMIDASPHGPVRAYLRTLFERGNDEQPQEQIHADMTEAIRREAGAFVLGWFATRHHWRHES